jgi:hypothetical protein
MAWADAGSGSGSGVGAKLARLVVHHTRSLACAAAHRTRAQRTFDGAFAHFFRKDYDAFRTSFAPDLVLTWHADPVSAFCRGVCVSCVRVCVSCAMLTERVCVYGSRWARCSTAMARRG